jgi:hypothetical protein
VFPICGGRRRLLQADRTILNQPPTNPTELPGRRRQQPALRIRPIELAVGAFCRSAEAGSAAFARYFSGAAFFASSPFDEIQLFGPTHLF